MPGGVTVGVSEPESKQKSKIGERMSGWVSK